METVLLPAIRAAGFTVVPQQDLGLVITMPADWEPPADMPALEVVSDLDKRVAPVVAGGGETLAVVSQAETASDLAERLAPVVVAGEDVLAEVSAPEVASDLAKRLAVVVAPEMTPDRGDAT